LNIPGDPFRRLRREGSALMDIPAYNIRYKQMTYKAFDEIIQP